MVIVEKMFTTDGATRLITGAKLVLAFTSPLSGDSSSSNFGGGFVLAEAPGHSAMAVSKAALINLRKVEFEGLVSR